jgi:hypothetical protein
MELIGVNALQIAFVLVSTWLGSRSSRLFRFAFLALLALGSIYLGWFGLYLVSPQMALASPISASSRQVLMAAFVGTAALSVLLLLPGTQRIIRERTSWCLQTPQQIFGAWLFVIVLLVNLAFLFSTSSVSLSLVASGTYQKNPLLNELIHDLSYLIIALLGAGLYLKRSPLETLKRLGLTASARWREAIGMAIIVGGSVAMLGIVSIFALMRIHPVTLGALEQTLSPNLPGSPGMLPIVASALLFGVAAGVSEGILFQGLLQPTFGLVPAALLFTVLHSQFGFSPVLLLVFMLGVGCGWLRQRYATWAAILAHMLCTTLLLVIWQLLFLH